MGSRYEMEVTISSAKDLKNVNWRHGPLKPYAVLWIDPASKCSTRADPRGDTSPLWDEKLTITLTNRRIDESTLCIDIVHAGAAADTKPLVGSARVPLRGVVDEAGIGGKWSRSLNLKRPSGRPQGKIEIKVVVRDAARSYAPPYGIAAASRDNRGAYGHAQLATGFLYTGGSSPAYAKATVGYGQTSYGQLAAKDKKKTSNAGLGTGLAVGAAAGLLGGLALAEGVDYVEDRIADDVAERVEDDLGYDDDGGYYGDDF